MNKDNKKFATLLQKTEEKMGDNTIIDFSESDIDKGGKKTKTVEIPPKSGRKKERERRKVLISVYLTESEHEAFVSTFKPLERKSEKVRQLILDYIRKEENKCK